MRITTVSAIIVILFTSCIKELVCIEGNGQVTAETRDVALITEVVNTAPVDVIYLKADTTGIEVRAESNLIPHIVTVISNGRLEVRTNPKNACFNYSKRPVVKITSPRLIEAELTGSGNFSADTLWGTAVSVKMTASGSMLLESVTCTNLTVTITGSGGAELPDADCQNADITLTASGDLELKGNCSNATMRITGSGDVESIDFILQTASETITGSGNIYTRVVNTLNAVITGSGNIYLRGNPAITQSITGSGKIIGY